MDFNARIILVLALGGAGALAGAAMALAQGDGSGTDNPDLLRGSLGVGCRPGTLCQFPATDASVPVSPPTQPLPLAAPSPAVAVTPPAPARPAYAVEPLPAAMAAPLSTDTADWGELGYGVALRGAYVRSGSAEHFEMLAIPSVSYSRSGGVTDVTLDASATLVAPQSDDVRVGAANVSTDIVHRLSPSAGLAFNGDLALSQDAPDGLSTDEADLASAPVSVSGAAGVGYTHRFGNFSVTGTGELARDWVGEATRADDTVIDNSHEGATRYGGALRVGYDLTPVVGVFGQGGAGRTEFDGIDPDLGASRSGDDFELRGGITANWSDVVTLEASVGSGWRMFDAAAIPEAQTWLYGVSLDYSPTTATAFTARLETELTPGSGGSGASATYDIGLEARHRANSWLGLRASVGAQWEVPEDGSATSRSYSAGLGADVALGQHTTATLDYDYGLREDPAAAVASRDEHRISGGVSLQY
ncbi:outer membrane beta-barrel protein [Pelagibacterium halotolerans]|uniref:outer membrane beta-barrel protein n=1 Tax=Pelagibacterium halotolerans TaxID=531813 RepID=UPI00089A0646|nr:outer membrane beta-barrel protein [Pelagibacterium halotolerans]QJR17573.1 outer membrane beta-barrel protein [Pelagibacterium halotolerans]SEA85044.1 Putative beta-barrel porin 2 [Pelagibacterium halotolerans]